MQDRLIRSVFSSLFAIFLFVSIGIKLVDAEAPSVDNLIFIIGDGTGFQQLETARIVRGSPLNLDSMPIRHQVDTSSLSHSVTDSAAGATALATGHKTKNRMVAMSPEGQRYTSILTLAKRAEKATGVVVTDMLYGATPGGFIAHALDRENYDVILEEAIFHTRPNVMLGGGMNVFDEIDVRTRLHETPYRFISTRDELFAWNEEEGDHLLGIFAPNAIAYEVERPATQPGLVDMVHVALDVLSREENGFFLMIEGSRIDHAGHANDLRRSIYETLAFDEAIGLALDFARKHGDTTVIVTADHETGGLTPSVRAPSALIMKNGIETVSRQISNEYKLNPGRDIAEIFTEYAGITQLESRVSQGHFVEFIQRILSQHVFYYSTTGHTGSPVPLAAYGPYAELFKDAHDTADVGRIAIQIFGVGREEEQR